MLQPKYYSQILQVLNYSVFSDLLVSIEQAFSIIVIYAGQVEVTSLQQRVCRVTEANSGKMSLCSKNALAPYGQLPLFSLSIPQGSVNESNDR